MGGGKERRPRVFPEGAVNTDVFVASEHVIPRRGTSLSTNSRCYVHRGVRAPKRGNVKYEISTPGGQPEVCEGPSSGPYSPRGPLALSQLSSPFGHAQDRRLARTGTDGPPDSNASSQALGLLGEAFSKPSIPFYLFCSFCHCLHLPEAVEGGRGRAEHLGAKSKFLQKQEPSETLRIASSNLVFLVGRQRPFRINRWEARSLVLQKSSFPSPPLCFFPSSSFYRGRRGSISDPTFLLTLSSASLCRVPRKNHHLREDTSWCPWLQAASSSSPRHSRHGYGGRRGVQNKSASPVIVGAIY